MRAKEVINPDGEISPTENILGIIETLQSIHGIMRGITITPVLRTLFASLLKFTRITFSVFTPPASSELCSAFHKPHEHCVHKSRIWEAKPGSS